MPRQANGGMQGGCSSATAALLHLTSRGKALELDKHEMRKRLCCPDKQMGKRAGTGTKK
ncbi:hypothetical protein [Psychrobacillus sp. NPDC093200]|uniref:hypothetical protein n=1 Tax=Psychrobacillus sp. NPDC093200 TaxID=3390656 RepID=UPI003D045B0E